MADGAAGGTTFGPYRVLQRIGEGGMGVVHLALDPQDRPVALKTLRPAVVADPAGRRRMAREVEALRRLRHPRIAKVLDADLDGDVPYLVTEFVAGPALDAAVAGGGPLDGVRLRRLGRGLLEALTHLHDAGVVHRDVKPGNVIVRDDDPVLIDFGIAHVADASRITSVGLVIGTPGYLSPEAAAGGDVDERADWWGWAATLAFAATGRPPFGVGTVPVVMERIRRSEHDLDGVPRPLRDVLADALGSDPTSRPGPRELLDALEARPSAALPGAMPSGARPVSALAPTRLDAPPLAQTRVAPPAPTLVLTVPGPVVPVALRSGPPPAGPGPVSPEPTPPTPPTAPSAPAVPTPSAARGEPASVLVTAVLVATGILLTAGAAVLPPVAAASMAALVVVARLADRLHAARDRRRRAGKLRHERLALTVGLPVHLVAESLATLAASTIPFLAGAAAAWAAAQLGDDELRGSDPAPGPAAAAVGVFLVVAWVRPEAGPLRRGARLLGRSAVRTDRRAGVALTLAAAGLVTVAVSLALGLTP